MKNTQVQKAQFRTSIEQLALEATIYFTYKRLKSKQDSKQLIKPYNKANNYTHCFGFSFRFWITMYNDCLL